MNGMGVVETLVSIEPADTVADLRAENRLLRAELSVLEVERDNLVLVRDGLEGRVSRLEDALRSGAGWPL